MFIPKESLTRKLEIKRSLFIASAFPVEAEEEAKILIQQQRSEHPKCSHVVWAYILGGEKSQLKGMSDDGEPKGTAGKPVLSVLQYSGMTNVLVTVVRYFGGTKLGKGGLVKAYTDSAKGVLEELPKKKLRKETRLYLKCGYKHFDAVKAAMEKAGAKIESEKFESDISITVTVAEDAVQIISEQVLDCSNGTAVIYPEASS